MERKNGLVMALIDELVAAGQDDLADALYASIKDRSDPFPAPELAPTGQKQPTDPRA